MEKGATTARPLIGVEARVTVVVLAAVTFDVMTETHGGRSGAWSMDVEASGYGHGHAWKQRWGPECDASAQCTLRVST